MDTTVLHAKLMATALAKQIASVVHTPDFAQMCHSWCDFYQHGRVTFALSQSRTDTR